MGAVPGLKDRKYTIQHMWDKHHNIVRMIVLGKSNTEIAEAIGCTPQNVSDIRNSPLVQSRVSILRQRLDGMTLDVAKEIENAAPECLKLLRGIVDGTEEGAHISLRAKTAMQLMDRAGYAPVHKMEIKTETQLSPEDMEAIREQGRKIKALAVANGVVVDADFQVIHNDDNKKEAI